MNTVYVSIDYKGTCLGDVQEVYQIYLESDDDVNGDIDDILDDNLHIISHCCCQCYPSITIINKDEAQKRGIDGVMTLRKC